MPNKQRKLVIIKPKDHEVSKGLSVQSRAELQTEFNEIKDILGGGRVMIFSQDSKCAIETAYLAKGVFDTFLFMPVDVLHTEEAHMPKAKSLKDVIKLLNVHQREFDNLLIVTHIGDCKAAPIFSDIFFKEELDWKLIETTKVGNHEVFEYLAIS